MAQEIYHRSNWGNPTKTWGNTYLNADLTNELYKRASEYENSWVTDQLLNGVGTKPSIILTPTAYEDGVLNSVKPQKTFGSELVPSIATISNLGGGSITQISGNSYSSTSDGTSGSAVRPKFDFATTSGKTYKLVITPIGTITGTVNFDFYDGSSYLFQDYDFTTTKEITFTDNGSVFGAFDGTQTYSISNFTISIKEVIEADFDFTRGSSATRVNELGLVEDVQILSGELVQNGDFEQIGSELVTNGGFDSDTGWTKGSGWSIANGSLNGVNATSSTYQNNGLVSGKFYKVVYEVSNYSSGTVQIKLGGTLGEARNENGTYTEYIKASQVITWIVGTNFSGSIDNVSVKEVGQNWTFGTGWSMGDGKAIFDTSSNSSFITNLNISSGNLYRLKIEGEVTSGNIKLSATSGLGNGQAISLPFEQEITHDGGANTVEIRTISSAEGFISNVSVIEITDDTDLPRINYTNGEGSLLLEPQSTNLVTYSEDFSQWDKSDATITSSSFNAPNGTQNASTLTTSASGGTVQDNLSVSNGNVTFSVFVKKGTTDGVRLRIDAATDSNGYFDLVNNTVYSSTNEANIENYGNGWYRISISANITSFVKASIYTTDGTTSYDNGTLHIWGAQVENLSYATSYIVSNSGSTTTRLADVCNNSGNSDLINSTEGVLYAEISALANDGTFRQLTISDSSTSDRISIDFTSTSNQIRSFCSSGGSTVANMTGTVTDVKQFNKVAVKYKLNDYALWINGVEVATDTSASTPTGLKELAFDNSAGSNNFKGNVKCLAVFKEALSDTELQKLTTI